VPGQVNSAAVEASGSSNVLSISGIDVFLIVHLHVYLLMLIVDLVLCVSVDSFRQ